MYSKFRTLSAILSLANTSINIPRDAVIDKIVLKLAVTVANASGTSWTSVHEAVLRAIQEIRVISDGSTVHYALSAADVAILDAFNEKYGIAPKIDDAITIADSANAT